MRQGSQLSTILLKTQLPTAIVQSNTYLVYGNIKYVKQNFILCVDDFGIKHHSKDNLNHLLNSFRATYEILTDPSGTNYIGITISWQYKQGHVYILMYTYVLKALQKFQHTTPSRQQHAPHKWTEPACGQKVQYVLPPCSLPILDKKKHDTNPSHQ